MSPRTTSALTPPATEQSPLPARPLVTRQAPAALRLAQPDEGFLPGGSEPGGGEPAGGRTVRPLDVAKCALCGFTHPLGLLVPDGGPACDDVHWYCKDARACTERWTTALAETGRADAARSDAQPPAAGQAGGTLDEVHPLSAAS
jgi:hypothetical protein